MNLPVKSIRSFIGAKDFETSRRFYRDLGFTESVISINMSYYRIDEAHGFYLQDAYVEDWVNNTMIFLEVENVDEYLSAVAAIGLPEKYPGVKLSGIRIDHWGSEFFLHDPAGNLWHFGAFK